MMDNQTLQALTALAEKLGTTTEYLWAALMRQAPISGAIDLAVMAAWVIGVVCWFRFVQRMTADPSGPDGDGYRHRAQWSDEFGVALAWCSVALAAVLVALMVGSYLSSSIAGLVNPEYWSLNQLLKAR